VHTLSMKRKTNEKVVVSFKEGGG